jgi:hypothetical protein
MLSEISSETISSEQMSSSALDSPTEASSLDDPPSKFMQAVLLKLKDPSAPSSVPDHSNNFDEEYQVYFNVMKELVTWEERVQKYEDTFEKLDPEHMDFLKLTYQENLIPFVHHMKILIRNTQEEIADEIQGILEE